MSEEKKDGLIEIGKNEKINKDILENIPDMLAYSEKGSETEIAIEKMDESAGSMMNEKLSLGGIVAAGQQRQASEKREKEIEKILEKGLDEVYLAMPEAKRVEFRLAGEKTLHKINDLIEKGRASMKTIIDLIRSWLSLVPGVNKFFLEQEAKIKADEIMNINKKHYAK